jgi:hypothetical protein
LLGIKVIKLNKIRRTVNHRLKICSPLETGASFFSKLETSGYRLKPKPTKPAAASPSASESAKISVQNHRQKIGVGLMPNVES